MTVVYLPPAGIKLPPELRRLVNRLAHREPRRRAMLERQAVRWWLEYGAEVALQRLQG